jgi:hypothetical protein
MASPKKADEKCKFSLLRFVFIALCDQKCLARTLKIIRKEFQGETQTRRVSCTRQTPILELLIQRQIARLIWLGKAFGLHKLHD